MRIWKLVTAYAAANAAFLALAVDGVWCGPESGGNWSDPTNWEDGAVPGLSEGDTAVIHAVAGDARVVLDIPVTLSSLEFHRTLTCADGGSMTLKGADGGPAYVSTMSKGGSIGGELSCGWTLLSDLELELRTTGYNRMGPFSGAYNIHVNRGGSNQTLYDTSSSPGFFGDWHIYYGGFMSGGDPFGSETGGVRRIHLYNRAALKINGNGTLKSNRALHIDATGGTLKPNGRALIFPMGNDWLTGEGTVFMTDDGNYGGSFSVGGTNANFSGSFHIGELKSDGNAVPAKLIFTETAYLPEMKEIFLRTTNAVWNVAACPDGFVLGSGQTLSGCGTVDGSVVLDGADAAIIPGFSSQGESYMEGPLAVTSNLTVRSGARIVFAVPYSEDGDLPGAEAAIVVGGSADLDGSVVSIVMPESEDGEPVLDPDSGSAFWEEDRAWPLIRFAGGAGSVRGRPAVADGDFYKGSFVASLRDGVLWLEFRRGLGATVLLLR